MTTVDVEKTVRRVMSTVLQHPIADGEEVSADSDDDWDSLRHVEIMFSLEDAFDIRFSDGELQQLRTLGSIVSAVRKRRESTTTG